ncbi:hypothetical protein RB195_015758 [Necator americanus]|uniref:Uncharacterized protein n=1 Tax=Necator americanus TaxID=51031 RepID=A0ABR1E7Y0_NECAM
MLKTRHRTAEFGQADVLSHLIPPRPTQREDIVIAKIVQDILAVQSAAVKALPVTKKTTEEESRKDEKLSYRCSRHGQASLKDKSTAGRL